MLLNSLLCLVGIYLVINVERCGKIDEIWYDKPDTLKSDTRSSHRLLLSCCIVGHTYIQTYKYISRCFSLSPLPLIVLPKILGRKVGVSPSCPPRFVSFLSRGGFVRSFPLSSTRIIESCVQQLQDIIHPEIYFGVEPGGIV